MGADCGDHCETFDGASPAFKRALWAVIAINATMFVVEMIAGQLGHSVALQADALDFIGDTFTYAISLFVIGMPLRARASAALFKGTSLLLMGAFILGTAVWRVFVAAEPEPIVMSGIALLALAANVASVLILIGFKDGDSNVRSVWLCSRNDAIGNVAVLCAGGLVALTGTRWPDLAVAMIMAGLFTWSAAQILRQALGELRHAPAPAE